MKLSSTTALLIVSCLIHAVLGAEQVGLPFRRLHVYHTINNGPYAKRGTIKYDHTSLKKSANTFEPLSEDPLILRVEGGIADRSSLYRVAVRIPGSDKELNASTPFCFLYGAGFKDHITIHVDEKGEPWHLDYLVPSSECKSPEQGTIEVQFKTQVTIMHPVPATRPQLEEIVQGSPDGKPPPEKSFLQKYWMYIVPILIILLLNGGEDSQGGPARR
ncbi:ER membrane protein complex subunit 10 [Rhizophlyctis rosea]|uniref:ER membrane protein complex subunit 10 n=1 Tax=Rhizophlyctis rosea TaxID=64517 RepID=A0AAD5X7W2_9FUNG|nr:ER membrane protein complex subunit 10 [Rhizophlyctis rosea]